MVKELAKKELVEEKVTFYVVFIFHFHVLCIT